MQRNNFQEGIIINKPSPTKHVQPRRHSPKKNINNNFLNIGHQNVINTLPIPTNIVQNINSPVIKSYQTFTDKDLQEGSIENQRLRQQILSYLYPTNLKLSSRHLTINRDVQISKLLSLYKKIDQNAQQIAKLEKKMLKLSESKKTIMNIKNINRQLHRLLSKQKEQKQHSKQ